MQFLIFLVAFFASLATASPLQERQVGLCSSAFDTALCCDFSVDGVANLNCDTPILVRTKHTFHPTYVSNPRTSIAYTDLDRRFEEDLRYNWPGSLLWYSAFGAFHVT